MPNFEFRGKRAPQALAVLPASAALPAHSTPMDAYFAKRKAAALVAKANAFQPSPQQQAFFDWIADGAGSLILRAAAGCGKTTTLIEALRLMQGDIFFGAYNKDIAAEIKAKATKAGIMRAGLFIATMHGAGFRGWTYTYKNSSVDDGKVRRIVDSFAKDAGNPTDRIMMARTFICALVSFGKQFLIGVKTAVDNAVVWAKLADHFSVDQSLPGDINLDEAIAWAIEVYKRSHTQCPQVIDFDDMLYAPIAYNNRIIKNDWVLIDEAQDMNPARREYAARMLKPGGRLVAVGDDRQAIYGFCHPPGTLIKTPKGRIAIEDAQAGNAVLVSHSDGQVQGWTGGNKVLETHKYYHTGQLITLTVGNRKVQMTPHHKVPVAVDPNAQYYTYLMCRNGVYRVGYCKAYAKGMFMLSLRYKTEKVQAAWILGAHATKEEAKEAEERLFLRVKGTTFNLMTDEEVDTLATEEGGAMRLLAEHGRMVDFPLLHSGCKHRFARNGNIVTEACNIMNGMRMVFWDENQAISKNGARRQKFVWTSVKVSSSAYSGYVYGITVQPPYDRCQGTAATYPLYFAGDDILVHNTGSGGNAIELIKDQFKCAELPLSVTYRCPQKVVEFLHQFVPVEHITAHPSAPEGEVRPVIFSKPAEGTALPWYQQDLLKTSDVILCRYNAPLLTTAFAMIRDGIACKVAGRDIGKGLITLARTWKITKLTTLRERLAKHLEQELIKAAKLESERRAQEITDKVDCLYIFIERCQRASKHTIDELGAEIEAMFADTIENMITLSSGHKAKGKEWRRVFWLRTAIRGRPKKEWEAEQEQNVDYVMASRVKAETGNPETGVLVLVPEQIHSPKG